MVDVSTVLAGIPPGLRNSLLESFRSIARNFREHRWEPAELNGGKFSEVVYTILKGHVDGAFPCAPSKPNNMVDACRALESAAPGKFGRSVRIQIPRLLIALYEIRNNRGVGHIGGDVDPNHMDAVAVLYMTKWVMAELVRLFHDVDTTGATEIVDVLVDRAIPLIWEVGKVKRVLHTKLTMKAKTLALLYSCPAPVSESDLVHWVEHSNASIYRRDVLLPAHKERLIEYDRENHVVHLSPKGLKYVEEHVPLEI